MRISNLKRLLPLGCALYLGTTMSSLKAPPNKLAQAEEQFQPQELKADLEYLFDTIEAIHPNPYAFSKKATIVQERTRLASNLTHPMSRLEFYRLVAPLVSGLRDEHTVLAPPREEYRRHARAGLLFPVRPIIWENRIFVRTNYSDDVNLSPGTEILRINGLSSRQLLDKLCLFAVGRNRESQLAMVETVFHVMLWVGQGYESPFHISLRRDGKILNESVVGIPETIIHDKEKAAQALDDNVPYGFRLLEDGKTGLLEVRGFGGGKGTESFLEQTFSDIKKAGVRALIADLRENDGGLVAISDVLLSYLATKSVVQLSRVEFKVSVQSQRLLEGQSGIENLAPFDRETYSAQLSGQPGQVITFKGNIIRPSHLAFGGKLYVLIGRRTCSAASLLAASVKDQRLGVLVGEETGGAGTQYGDPFPFELPRTKLTGIVAHTLLVRASGKDLGQGVTPDYEVPVTPADIIASRDPVLERVLGMIRSGKRQENLIHLDSRPKTGH